VAATPTPAATPALPPRALRATVDDDPLSCLP
jgi:hypothetical protein